jgi:tetratricopeptide (TPR) repeat protein
MTIADPHAIPEAEHDAHDYLTEADQAWESGDEDLAYALYHALFQSHAAQHGWRSHAAYRCGLIDLNRGDTDRAHLFLEASDEPGAAEALHSLNNATHDDPAPDPNVVPDTVERSESWYAAGTTAMQAGDWEKAYGLMLALTQTTCNPPNEMARYQANVGMCLWNMNQNDTARQWLEHALPSLADEHLITQCRKALHDLGGGVADDTTSAAAHQFSTALQAYESGDAHGARGGFEAALHAEGPDDVKGKAHYYLGAMDYQERRYADARDHVEAAVQTAPDPEKGWAQAMLAWRWDEQPA